MPFMNCSFYSECLGMPANVMVILPRQKDMDYSGTFPVVYILHGLMDDYDSWFRRTSLERYCDENQIAAVLPQGGRSFYTDMAYGYDYFTHVSEEVPKFCETVFPIGGSPEKRFITGNSMGGYGALKTALKRPGFFSKAAAISGVMDINSMIQAFPEYQADWICCFGEAKAPDSEDLFYLMEKAAQKDELLPLYQYCGTKDFLYQDNLRFLNFCRQKGISICYQEEQGGIHEWNHWDVVLPVILQWFLKEES